jgi:hypothetical protein
MSGDLAIVLLFEPRSIGKGPVVIGRVSDPSVVELAAKSIIRAAETRAADVGTVDEFVGEVVSAEACRLKRLLTMLLPGLALGSGGQ